jgi:hypothetical protein
VIPSEQRRQATPEELGDKKDSHHKAEVIPMDVKKTVGTILLVVGVAVLLVSLAADPLGLGGNPIFGRNQMIGAVVGAVVAIVGAVLRFRK